MIFPERNIIQKKGETYVLLCEGVLLSLLPADASEYEKKEDGKWHKVGMACNSDPNCQTPAEECKHYKIAPEVVPVDQLRETKL